MRIAQNKLKTLRSKKLIVFDLDGTLAETKSVMDKEMGELMIRLLSQKKVAVIGGGKYDLFKMQLKPLKRAKQQLSNLFLFPTTSTSFYRYRSGWKQVYAHTLTKAQRHKIKKAFAPALKAVGYVPPKKIYGKVIEDRGTQVTWSALGQDVVKILGKKRGVAMKDAWKQKYTPLKMEIAKIVAKQLPEFEVRTAAYTSIDVTRKGIDKAYGLKQIEKYLKVKIKDMVFIGDAIFPGGNDYAVTKTSVDYVAVAGPEGTKQVVRALLE